MIRPKKVSLRTGEEEEQEVARLVPKTRVPIAYGALSCRLCGH